MRDRPNEVVNNIVELAREALETKFLKDSAYFIARVQGYSSSKKAVIVPFPDSTVREVRMENTDQISKSVKVGQNVLVINAGFPSHTYDKTYAILYNRIEPGKLEPEELLTPEDRLISIAAERARGRYRDITEETQAELARLEVLENLRQDAEERAQDSITGHLRR